MKRVIKFWLVVTSFTIMSVSGVEQSDQHSEPVTPVLAELKVQLGQQLFFDSNLSYSRTMSCATCHAPAQGFIDRRSPQVAMAASLGDDAKSFGDRNAPTVGYAAFSPRFHRRKDGIYAGGQFWDGRASTLADQAGGPPLNPIEMGMPDKATVVERILENKDYQDSFKGIYGEAIFQNHDNAYAAMTDSIAEFEKSDFFSPFDSKYDRYLRSEYKMTPKEELGRTLFFSQQFTNCNLCHQLRTTPNRTDETFTNYQFHNIGVPANQTLRGMNGVKAIDDGLMNNPAVQQDVTARGKYKTPSLRNVAITAPYMHNGMFGDLRTVILFYNKYNSRSKKRQINPETGEHWRAPEVDENISLTELETGPALDDKRINALVAFLETLTDKRYEGLLKKKGTE